jgi:hypothetical protein
MDREASIKLLSTILADTVRLPGAACIGKHRMYDPIVENRHRYRDREWARLTKAARVCAGCPVIQRCNTVATMATVEVMPAPRRPPPPSRVLAFYEVIAPDHVSGASSTLVRYRKAGSSPLSGSEGRVVQPGGHITSGSAAESTRAPSKSASPGPTPPK